MNVGVVIIKENHNLYSVCVIATGQRNIDSLRRTVGSWFA